MDLAFRMASRAIGTTANNPAVGCVIVKDNNIISRGWTQPSGRPHAEVHAINQIRDKTSLVGAEIYCSLEPCSHFGKTNPCVESIIKSGISKVYVASIDKNPLVNGKGIAKLKKLNIKVQMIFNRDIDELNNIFFNSKLKKRPLIISKIASTLDSKIATASSESKWITNSLSRSHGHYLRFKCDAMLVGKNTILLDNPDLRCRLNGLQLFSPNIFILDSNLEIPAKQKIFKSKKRQIYIFHRKNLDKKKLKKFNKFNVVLLPITLKDGVLDVNEAILSMAELGAQRVLVEGGAELLTQLINKKLVDILYWFRASKLIGKDGLNAVSNLSVSKMKSVKELKLISSMQIQTDTLEVYERK
ncbi:bifunctional diaminohydroxyphosphoribosylaminopyrimidine deaminase/5-amino-6-(5-phosphoribosylamino)uracil reductase RibD [Pelagibacterales bacterium]|nr:bifunctional diaminohydroxyphosphoribosylaminopyrimidine deaminase/5-amino-6-(5-phosphoribosylamino)uracil reductase RibD [Pelagibacterales bacterium]